VTAVIGTRPTRAARLLERSDRDRRRAVVDRAMRLLALLAAIVCVAPLAAVVLFVTLNGIAAINLELLTKPPRALGTGGGAAGAILGSMQMVGLATLMAVPAGILAGVYVNEFAARRSARVIRFAADVLVGVPSILVGIFVFTFLVLPFKQYNAFAGSVALAVIMLPVIMRTTEEILALVPGTLREASLSLGVPVWRTVLSVVVPTGIAGILTGVMLAVARAAGETAPLLFTALGSRLINVGDFREPMDALPLFIYANARQPFAKLNEQAWGAAFLLLVFVLTINVLVRFRTWGRRAG
jgi:phosphate transport system permease protein